MEVCEKLKHCKNKSICPQCCLKQVNSRIFFAHSSIVHFVSFFFFFSIQISSAEDDLLLLKQTLDESEMKTMSSKIGNEINTLRTRLLSLEEENKRFKTILLEALHRIELRKDCWIARRTTNVTKSTVEFIRAIFCFPKFILNTGEIDGLNYNN